MKKKRKALKVNKEEKNRNINKNKFRIAILIGAIISVSISGNILLWMPNTILNSSINYNIDNNSFLIEKNNNVNVASANNINKNNNLFNILIFYNELSSTNDRLKAAIQLEETFNCTFKNTIDEKNPNEFSPDLWDLIMIIDFPLNISLLSLLENYIASGKSIFLVFGEHMLNNETARVLYQLGLITQQSIEINTAKGVCVEEDIDNPIVNNIEWNSAPELIKYAELDVSINTEVLVSLTHEGGLDEKRWPMMIKSKTANLPFIKSLSNASIDGNILITTAFLTSNDNLQFIEWLYYCYVIYASISDSLRINPLLYGDWEHSPVPHEIEKTVLITIIIIIATSSLVFFVVAKRKSKEILQEEYLKRFSEQKKGSIGQENNDEEDWDPTKDNWEDIGSHRQISGFLLGFFAGILLLIPQVGLTLIVFPRYIMPFPAVAGMYGYAQDIFRAMWTLLDMSTSVALAKYFSEYRVEHPEKAIRYIQIFIWWQFLSGVFQMSLVTALGLFVFPHTNLAHMSYLFIFHSFIQFPGWFQVLIFVFQGMQRVDLQLISNILQMVVFDLLSKYTFILLFRAIFRNIPAYGEVFGAMLGYAVGEWCGQFFTFIFTAIMFKKLGFHLQTLYRVDFGMEEFKEVMIFGGKIVLGAMLVPAVFFLQAILAAKWIYNYNAELGYYSIVYQMTQIIALVNLFSQSIMSGMSESYGNKKYKLYDLYMFQGFKWSNYAGFFIISSLAVVMWRLVLGAMGPTWERAIAFIPILIARAAFEPYTWLGDKAFQASEKTGRLAISWVVEQGSRVIFLLLLMQKYQMMGILMAWFISLVLKIIYQYYAISKYIRKPKVYWWQSFIAPGLAALLNYGLFELVARVVFRNDILTSVLLFLGAFFVFFFGYSFFVGWFGGWDDNTLKEYKRAAYMVKGVGFLVRKLYKATELGANHSIFGLHNKYPVKIYNEAAEEARELTLAKKKLKM